MAEFDPVQPDGIMEVQWPLAPFLGAGISDWNKLSATIFGVSIDYSLLVCYGKPRLNTAYALSLERYTT